MRVDILSLFPGMFDGVFEYSIIKRAKVLNELHINIIDFREFSTNKHKKVDDYPYGGGAGMVLSIQPIYDALKSIDNYEDALVILMTPQGKQYKQSDASSLTKNDHIIIICGHYEGFDERIRKLVDLEISVGDYVLTGGEIGAMILVDSISRLLPNVLGNSESYLNDSFYNGLLEHPHFTRPADFKGMKVPDVLLSGNHKEIDKWREIESLKRTKERRPDLLKKGEGKNEKKMV